MGILAIHYAGPVSAKISRRRGNRREIINLLTAGLDFVISIFEEIEIVDFYRYHEEYMLGLTEWLLSVWWLEFPKKTRPGFHLRYRKTDTRVLHASDARTALHASHTQ